MQKDLGLVTAYGAALEGGYTGTYEEYKTEMANLLGLDLATRVEVLENNYGTVPVDPSVTPTKNGSVWITTI